MTTQISPSKVAESKKISIVDNAKATATSDCEVREAISQIRNGKWKEQIQTIRREYAETLARTGNPIAAKRAVAKLKQLLPALIPSGTFSSRERPTNTRIIQHSGLLCADLDDLKDGLDRVRANLVNCPHAQAVFLSPTGTGLKCLFRVSNDPANHLQSFEAVRDYVVRLTGSRIDESCKDLARLCFFSYDPDAFQNEEARELLPSTPYHIRLHTASASCLTTSLDSCIPASLHHTPASVLRNIRKGNEAKQTLKTQNPQLASLYSELVENRFQPSQGERNSFLTNAIPFLFRAVAKNLILELVAHFYDRNQAMFADGREQHIHEAEALLRGVGETYLNSLGSTELEIYQALPHEEQDAFRICRDLALRSEPQREAFTFYLSCDHLAMRLGVHPMQALRILRSFRSVGMIAVVCPGTRRQKGVKANATIYKWLIPSPIGAEVFRQPQ